ncbi:MAG: bifunctional [glutamate--ammonia ligase]-adenylyl-L-tyrosine phosphorylase/[glutamate--ammonia-ligase] adenylyltransferase [bacterium]|nr:MAG: bifunctional [glutamate--ammonia ligase]-adenylyl-L-tyrosine phosphorylase/[glutamate--ammonia-ligase] adenylyltransferase [bacterium]
MPVSDIDSLIQLIRKSGRFPDADSLRQLVVSIISAVGERGLPQNLPQESIKGALKTSDPQSALNRLARILTMVDDPNFYSLLEDHEALRSLLAILGYSNFLSSLIVRSPEDYVWLMRDVGLTGGRYSSSMRSDLTERLPQAVGLEEASRILRINKYREMLRIGVRDLLGKSSLEETVHDISNLAEASIDAAVEIAYQNLRSRHGVPLQVTDRGITRPGKFCVLGLGKLGGEELNYSSDVDLFYLYSTHEGMTTGRPSPSGGYRDAIENHRFFVRLGEIVTKLLNDRTEEGIVFRVDLRLRPEGEQGEIAYSLPSLEVYYQSWGRTTDRLALLKAKPLGGDRRLGEEFLELMLPFTYRRHLDYAALEEIGILKEKIDRKVDEGHRRVRDIKLGRGGIREIEFLVQSLQLIHGGRTPAIRERNTLRALDRLMRNGFLSERDAEFLHDAYVFLRTIEHRVQLVEERQTHTLPTGREDLTRLAYVLGFREDGGGDIQGLERKLEEVTDGVRACYDRLFFFQRAAPSAPSDREPNLLRESLSREEAIAELEDAGFSDPEDGYRNLVLLRDGPDLGHFTDTCRHLIRQIAPRLLAELKEVPDPDAVLINLNRFINRVGARASYYTMLADNPDSIRLLAVLFGSSPFLSRHLIHQPDLLDLMVSDTDVSMRKPSDGMVEEVAGILASSPSFEDELIMLRRYRHSEILRVGLGDLLGFKDVQGVNDELTDLAEALLQASFRMADRDVSEKTGGAPGAFGVVAMGKAGGREMNYSSDLDLIFLFSGGEGSRDHFTRVAQRIITILTSATGEGSLYRIDMRLRPSGHAGPLVSTIEAFNRYHREDAMVWERQALTKARMVAGTEDFAGEVDRYLSDLVYARRLSAEELREILRVRVRMEKEIAEEREGEFFDIKTGRGGLVDIEFAVQVLQLSFGEQDPSLRTQSTLKALSALRHAGLVDENQYNTLRRAYIFYREIENRSQIYQDRSDPRIPADEEKIQSLGRRMGYVKDGRTPGDFLEEIRTVREQVRGLYDFLMHATKKALSGSVREP